MENTIIARNYKFESKATVAIAKATEAEAVEEEPDEIAMQFLSAKMALDRLVELFSDDHYIAETLTELKTSLEIIEDGVAR